MKNFDINTISSILNFNKRLNNEETLQEQMNKIEELYPNCFEDVEFAKYIGEHKSELGDLHLDHLLNFFKKDSKEVIISYCDYHEFSGISQQINIKLENEIMESLSNEEYEELGLSDDVWIDYNAALMPRVQGEKNNVEGFRIEIMENEYDEEGLNPQPFSSPVGIFVPLDNFEDARIDHWNEAYMEENKDWEERLKPILEAVKNQRFKSMREVYQEVQYEQNKEFLDNNIEKVIEIGNAILEKNPTDRSEEVEKELDSLYSAVDSYIVEYGEEVSGKQYGEKFETKRLFNMENENTPVVISSIAYYMDFNSETRQYQEDYSEVWNYYDKDGQPDSTYSMSNHYFPSNENIKQYIDTEHISFDITSIQQILEKYKELAKENAEKHTISEIEATVADRNIGDINKVISEITEDSKDKKRDGQSRGE